MIIFENAGALEVIVTITSATQLDTEMKKWSEQEPVALNQLEQFSRYEMLEYFEQYTPASRIHH